MPSTRKILPESKILNSSLRRCALCPLALASLTIAIRHIKIKSLLTYRTMEHRDYNYYEENAATINLGGITSSARNAKRFSDGFATAMPI
eukprot:scaffold15895_cov155-Skeletonema_dohrnii-CCMP3373.AAC.2